MTCRDAIRVGLVLFVAGVVFLVVDVVPFFFGHHDRPLWLNLSCLAMPVGLFLAVGAALRRGRAEQRRALAELSGSSDSAGSSGDQLSG